MGLSKYKMATHCTPFSLAFGLEAVMPMEYLVPSLRMAVREMLTEESLTKRLMDQRNGERLPSKTGERR